MRYVVAGLVALSIVVLLVLGSTGALAQKELGEYWYRYGPYIDKITYPVMKDYTMRLLAFEAGELSMVGVLPAHLDRVRTNRPDAHIIFTVGISSLGALHFNVQNWPVKYLEVRQALAHLWNRDKIIAESPLRGIAVKCTTIPPPTHGAWVNWEADFEKLYPYDPERAKALLAKVFTPCTGPDGKPAWCDPRMGGRVVEIEILSLPEATSPTYWWIAMYIKEEAEKIGLRVTIKAVSSRELDAATSAGTAQAWIIGWLFGRFPGFMYYFFHSREIRPGGWNEWRVNDSRVDALLDKFYYSKDPNEAMKYGWQVQEILVKEIIPWIPTYTGVGITAWDGKIDRDSIILAYAPPLKDPVGLSYFWWNTVRFKDRKFGGVFRYYHTVDITTYHPSVYLWASEADAIFRVYTWVQVTRPENIYAEPRVPVFLRYWKVEETTYKGQKAYKFTVTLFEGIRWQDGVEMTAEDVAYTFLKFGKELKTRRDYGPYIDAMIDVVVVNKTTVEFYLKDYGWLDIYTFSEFRALPKHVFEKLPNPLEDPSTLPHPTIPGLTAMIGNGPFVLAKIREIAYAELVWNPWYFWRHPDRTVKFAAVEIPATVAEGTPFRVRVTLTDYLDARATNATVTVGITGPMTLTLPATHVGGGVYEVTVPGLRAGTYTVEVRAEQPIMRWSVDNKVVRTLTVGAAPAPAPVGPV
ncbi:MAG: ABC transporter substrate-binding protein, partial [Desulfurococcaceae archaeon]|nr:ABC transporter substrate-binding protein [Desulfurococcaceae archaeon]